MLYGSFQVIGVSNGFIAGHVGQPVYDTFLIVSLSGRSIYDPSPLRPNPNPSKPVSCSRVGSNIVALIILLLIIDLFHQMKIPISFLAYVGD